MKLVVVDLNALFRRVRILRLWKAMGITVRQKIKEAN